MLLWLRHMINKFKLLVLAGVLLAAASARAATLKLGDDAPPLQVGEWVQGDPLAAFDRHHVYILEFWATWYPPCQGALARLNGLAQQYQSEGLVAIGQNVFEKDAGIVPAFVKKMGDKMTFRVALDDQRRDTNGAMATSWMLAAGQYEVPTIFVINRQGKVAWIGHPLALDQSTLEQILTDRFDVAAHAQEVAKQEQRQQQEHALNQKLAQAFKTKNWDAAEAVTKEIEDSLPPSARFQVAPIRLQILIGRQDLTSAHQLAEALSDKFPNDAYLQNQLAWTLATANGVDRPCRLLAELAAQRANLATQGKVSGILDTLARTQFLNGKTNEAILTEQKAVDAESTESKPALKKCLEAYQQGKLPALDETAQ